MDRQNDKNRLSGLLQTLDAEIRVIDGKAWLAGRAWNMAIIISCSPKTVNCIRIWIAFLIAFWIPANPGGESRIIG